MSGSEDTSNFFLSRIRGSSSECRQIEDELVETSLEALEQDIYDMRCDNDFDNECDDDDSDFVFNSLSVDSILQSQILVVYNA